MKLLCAGAVAVLPGLFVSGVMWLVALAVLPGTVALVCATVLVLVLLVVSMSRSARWVRMLVRVLPRTRAATSTERASLLPALARLTTAGVIEPGAVEVAVRRRRTTRPRPALAFRSEGSSSAWVLVISADLTHATTKGPSTTEVARLLAYAIGRHQSAGRLAGRCTVTHAVWCVPGRIVAGLVRSMPIRRWAAPIPFISAARLVGLVVLARGISAGQPEFWVVLLSVVAVSLFTPALVRRWQAHLDAGGEQAIEALDRQAEREAQILRRRSASARTRATHLQLVPQPPPG